MARHPLHGRLGGPGGLRAGRDGIRATLSSTNQIYGLTPCVLKIQFNIIHHKVLASTGVSILPAIFMSVFLTCHTRIILV